MGPINDEDVLSVGSNKSLALTQPPWDESHEKVLIEWADKAQCFRWLHGKCYTKYRISAMWFTIPVIVMSTLTGTANFAQDRFPNSIQFIAVMGIGAINIFAGILTTISQYLKVNELMEGHRVANLSWDKFVRDIKMELAKDPRDTEDFPSQREPPITCLTRFKETFDRLMEVSPIIDEEVIKEFMYTFDEDKLRIVEQLKKRKQRILYHPKSGVPPICRPAVKLFKCYDCFNDPQPDNDIESQIDTDGNEKGINVVDLGKELINKTGNQVIRPDICGEMTSVALDRHPWKALEEQYSMKNASKGTLTNAQNLAKEEIERTKIKMQEDAEHIKKIEHQKEIEFQKIKHEEEEKHNLIIKHQKDQVKNRITNFVLKYKEKFHILPLVDDVIDELSDIDENEIRGHELYNKK
jgi:hypothetical protein